MPAQTPPQINIGPVIARRRLERDMTQDQLAERLGIGNEAVSRLERGITDVSLTKLAQLADIFECRLDELLNEASDRPDDQVQKIRKMIEGLDPDHRVFIVDSIKRLAAHLAK